MDAWVYRATTAPTDGRASESKYFLTAYEARSARDGVRAIGIPATVGRAPATAFELLADDELDQLAQDDMNSATQ